mmetsp:Transcript_12263/g.25407  ORF Transcript_12263/g.25407 Transcript_12263/m.25407 type:complete len:207 (-) Transcript_12263:400-1020(-)
MQGPHFEQSFTSTAEEKKNKADRRVKSLYRNGLESGNITYHGGWEIPWSNHSHHTNRLLHDHDLAFGRPIRSFRKGRGHHKAATRTGRAHSFASIVIEKGSCISDFRQGFFQRFSRFQRHDRGNILCILVQEATPRAQQAASLDSCRSVAPSFQGCLSIGNGQLGSFPSHDWHIRNHFTIGWIFHGIGTSSIRSNLGVDVQEGRIL